MIAELKPYPAMKDSGVPWLGEVPEHWEVRKVREVARVINGFPFDAARFSQSTGFPLIRIRDLDRTKTATRYDGPFVEAAKVRPGDVLIGMDGDFNVGTWRGTEPALLNQRMCCVRSTDPVTERLLAYVLPRPLMQINEVTWSTTVKHLASGQVERIQFGLPPPPEQSAIVRFLDHADRRIRRYIRAKQKLIKLLEELKAAIIHRAVTRGLDANVRLKPSGVEWLGDVPEHWEVTRLKTLVSRVTSGSRGWSNFAADAGVLFIRIGNLTRASVDLDMEHVIRLQLPNRVLGETARTRVQPDDILLSITAFIGSVAVVPANIEEAYVSQHVACCRPRVGASNPRWIAYVLLSHVGQTHGQLSMYGGTKQGLSLDDVKNYIVLLPPIAEQDQLVEWIERRSAGLDAGIRSTSREIALLREYRTRLIADVVTGKLDVREAAARLPDEAEEAEPINGIELEGKTDETGAEDTGEMPEEAEA